MVDLAVEQYKRRRRRSPRLLREDFCGTALVACHWVKGHAKRRAIGLDLDEETLQWAEKHNIVDLGKAKKRIELRNSDVRAVTEPKADVVQAFNFSYYLLHSLTELIDYFRIVRLSLAPGGIFLLDCFGGTDVHQPLKETRTVDGPAGSFGFTWEQAAFNPITNRTECHIHFSFKNSKKWKKAFSYDFRLYSLAEVQEALLIAGFTNIEVLWDHEEEEDADCDYQPTTVAENCPRWIAYLVADAEPPK